MISGKMSHKLIVCLIVLFTVSNGIALERSHDEGSCPTPLIFEYIEGFKLPLNDVALLLTNQYSHNNLTMINAPNKVYLTNIVYKSRLLSDDQSQAYSTPLSAIVFNQNTQFEVDYKILITEGGLSKKNKTFTANTKISKITITYQKDYVLENSSFTISKVQLKLNPESFVTTYVGDQPDQKQKDSFNTAIKGNASSLYASFAKLLSVDDVTKFMQSNTKKQPLSAIYKDNPYNYKFDDGRGVTITIPVDVTTTWVNATTPTSLTNGVSGILPQLSNTHCSQFVPNFAQHGGQLFITKQFVQNFIDYSLMAFSGWQNININKTTIRSDILQWQLLDLQYVVNNIWTDLYSVSENQIYFTCSAKQNLQTKFVDMKGAKVHQTIKWMCEGFVKLNATASQKVIEFYPTVDHVTNLEVYQGTLTPYVNTPQFIDCQFKDVPSMDGKSVYKVNEKNMKLIQKLIESTFNDFRVYTVGLRFWLGEKSRKIQIQDQARGFWVV